jgi:hypothetical protein
LDASLFKTIPLTERLKFRLNADFFNILNHPGNPAIAAGANILSTVNSGSSAREIQLTLRMIW